MPDYSFAERNRERLRFEEAVLSSFSFLADDFGFSIKSKSSTYVRFESNRVFVNVYHGRVSYEIGIEIGELNKTDPAAERHFTLGEVIALTDFERGSNFRFRVATTPELIQKFIGEAAELVRRYSGLGLKGDKKFFEQLGEIRSRVSHDYLRGMEMSRVRVQAEEAWQKRDYAQLVKVYEPVKDDLTPSETKRLEYAKRKLVGM